MGDGGKLRQAELAVEMLIDILQHRVQLRNIGVVQRTACFFAVDVIVVADDFGENRLQLDLDDQLIAEVPFEELTVNLLHQLGDPMGRRIVPVQPVAEFLAPFKKDQEKIVIEVVGERIPDEGRIEMNHQMGDRLPFLQHQAVRVGVVEEENIARADIIQLPAHMIGALAQLDAGDFQLGMDVDFRDIRPHDMMFAHIDQIVAVFIRNYHIGERIWFVRDPSRLFRHAVSPFAHLFFSIPIF